MVHFSRILLALGVLLQAVPVAEAQEVEASLSLEEKIYGLSLVWQEANYNFAYFRRLPELDWDGEFRRAIPRVVATSSNYAYHRELQRLVALLREGHTNLELRKEDRVRYGGHPAVELEEIQRRAVVVNASKELLPELPLGSVVTQVDGIPVPEFLEAYVFPFMSASTEHSLWRLSIRGHPWRALGLLMGETGSSLRLQFETPAGESREIVLERLAPGTDVTWQLPPRSQRPLLEFRWLDADIAYVALNSFNDTEIVKQFEDRIPELRSARAVILDVRQNEGGNSRNGWNIGRYFSEEPLEVSHWETRTHLAAYKAWGRYSQDPEKKAHAAMDAWDGPKEFSRIEPPESGVLTMPLAILLGPSTYSAAEDFLAFMRAVPQAVYVGRRSAGSTGQPLSVPIPGGAWVGITSKHDFMPDGTEFVGIGVLPDVQVEQTLDALRAGRDPVLEKAVEALRQRME